MKKVVLKNFSFSKDNMLSFDETKKVFGGWSGEGDGGDDGQPPNGFPTCLCVNGGWATMRDGLCPCWCVEGVMEYPNCII